MRITRKLTKDKLLNYLNKNPDRYLKEIASAFDVKSSFVFNTLKKFGISRKKMTLYDERDAQKRQVLLTEIKKIDYLHSPKHLEIIMVHRSILTDKQKEDILSLPITESHLLKHYILSNEDLHHINEKRKPPNRLGFALQLCAFRYPGYLL